MTLDTLFDDVDTKILDGCQYLVAKANDYAGWNKYTCARTADAVSFIGLGYYALQGFNPLSVVLAVVAVGQCFFGVKENKEREELEDSLEGEVISLELADKIGRDTEFRFLELLMGVMAGSCTFLASSVFPAVLPFLYGSCIGLCGHALGHYFRSCDFAPKKKELVLQPQEVEIKK